MGATAVYMRVSTDMQSVEAQRVALDNFIDRKPWADDPRTYFEEDGVSGRTEALLRPVFSQVYNRAKEGEFDRIVVLRIDRLCRNVVDLHRVAEAMVSANVTLIFAAQEDVSFTGGAISKYMLTTFGAAAELEADLIRERTKEGIAVRRAQGVRLGRPPREIPEATLDLVLARQAAGEKWSVLARELGIPVSTLRQYAMANRSSPSLPDKE